jgi:hypothetical protein
MRPGAGMVYLLFKNMLKFVTWKRWLSIPEKKSALVKQMLKDMALPYSKAIPKAYRVTSKKLQKYLTGRMRAFKRLKKVEKPFSAAVAITAAQIYHQFKKQNKLIEFRDIFIAATCITNQLPLITLNKKHFSRIEELTLV